MSKIGVYQIVQIMTAITDVAASELTIRKRPIRDFGASLCSSSSLSACSAFACIYRRIGSMLPTEEEFDQRRRQILPDHRSSVRSPWFECKHQRFQSRYALICFRFLPSPACRLARSRLFATIRYPIAEQIGQVLTKSLLFASTPQCIYEMAYHMCGWLYLFCE